MAGFSDSRSWSRTARSDAAARPQVRGPAPAIGTTLRQANDGGFPLPLEGRGSGGGGLFQANPRAGTAGAGATSRPTTPAPPLVGEGALSPHLLASAARRPPLKPLLGSQRRGGRSVRRGRPASPGRRG